MTENKSSIITAAKATLIGGVVFLIPAFLVFFVFRTAFSMLKSLAKALGSWLGITGPLGGALLDVATIAVVVLVCLLAVARRYLSPLPIVPNRGRRHSALSLRHPGLQNPRPAPGPHRRHQGFDGTVL